MLLNSLIKCISTACRPTSGVATVGGRAQGRSVPPIPPKPGHENRAIRIFGSGMGWEWGIDTLEGIQNRTYTLAIIV